MTDVVIIGVDLAKNVFQLHGAAADGTVVFRKKFTRPMFQRFMADHPRCLVAMEACGGAHHCARELVRLGHEVKLIVSMAPSLVRSLRESRLFLHQGRLACPDAKARSAGVWLPRELCGRTWL